MNTAAHETSAPSPLEHQLRPHFQTLAQFNSTKALEASALYARLRPEVERVLSTVVREEFARPHEPDADARRSARATAWNLERGARLEGIAGALRGHELMRGSDVLLLTELDYGMARSGNRHVARELAQALGMSYAFAPCYVALTKGNGKERGVVGENEQALHGNAVLARWPISRAWSVALPNGKDKMRGAEKRLGSQRAVVADVEHPAGRLRAVSLHLDAHSSQSHRHAQMKVVLDFVDSLGPRLPTLVGGDWNTSTYNSSHSVYSVFGFWRRVMMGVNHVLDNHYLRPDQWFERHLFRELERRGYAYQDLNVLRGGTLHYDVRDMAVNTNMADSVPQWCFKFIAWALSDHGGRCSLKLDWFAGRDLAPDPQTPPRVVSVRGPRGEVLSDHDPIVVDLLLP